MMSDLGMGLVPPKDPGGLMEVTRSHRGIAPFSRSTAGQPDLQRSFSLLQTTTVSPRTGPMDVCTLAGVQTPTWLFNARFSQTQLRPLHARDIQQLPSPPVHGCAHGAMHSNTAISKLYPSLMEFQNHKNNSLLNYTWNDLKSCSVKARALKKSTLKGRRS